MTINYLGDKRTIFDLTDDIVDKKRHYIGLLIYLVIFVIMIPYLLIKNNYYEILAGYFPNLDLIATCIGYHGGPANSFIWTHLYNPADSTFTGYITSNFINMLALLGVTYIIAYYTFMKKSIYKGWARAFIMLPMTYFIPSNIIIYYMNKFGVYLNKFFSSKSLIHYISVVLFGLIIITGFVLSETVIIKKLVPHIVKLLNSIY